MVLPTLAQLLGRPADARLLIVSCDDLGLLAGVTEGAVDALTDGVATTGSLMVPCPAARQAATAVRDLDVGVHLTLNCEWDLHQWGPVTESASLRRDDGSMFRSVLGLLDNATDDDVLSEMCAQVELALTWGLDVTHLDSHMYAVQDHARFQALYLQVAREYRLPVRLSGSIEWPDAIRERARAEQILAPDHLVALTQVGSRSDLIAALPNLRPGVTEFHAHPARDTAPVRELLTDWRGRVDDHDLYCCDQGFRQALSEVELIGFREVRDLMRSLT